MKLSIDGREVEGREGDSVLAVALGAGIDVPHLCSHPLLPDEGACRLCLVEIEGFRGYPASCTTPATDGMVVRTDSDALARLRRATLELILLEHPSSCLVCDKKALCEEFRPEAQKAGRTTGCHTCNNKGSCDLARLADRHGIQGFPVERFYRNLPVLRSDPFIDRDRNLCVLCSRCVRACRHHHGSHVIDVMDRGARAVIGTPWDRTLAESGCRFCGSCVDLCPTGALSDRYSRWYGVPDDEVPTTCTICDAGCAIRVASSQGRVTRVRAVDARWPLCALGRFAIPELLSGPRRLRVPTERTTAGVQRELPRWDEVLARVAVRLDPHRGRAFAFVCDPLCTLEDRETFQAFTETVMGSPHFVLGEADGTGLARARIEEGVTAAILTADIVDPARLEALDLVVILDSHASPASERAHFVLPVAILVEESGRTRDATGALRPLRRVARPPGQARPGGEIIVSLGAAMGHEDSWIPAGDGTLPAPMAAELRIDRDRAPEAALSIARVRTHFRGHRIADHVGGLAFLEQRGGAP